MARPRLSDGQAKVRGSRRTSGGSGLQSGDLSSEPPEWLREDEKVIWTRLVEDGNDVRLWRVTDQSLLMDICREQALVESLRDRVRKGGEDVESDDKLLNSASARLLKMKEQAGLTPRSRLRMQGALNRASEAESPGAPGAKQPGRQKTEEFKPPAAFQT